MGLLLDYIGYLNKLLITFPEPPQDTNLVALQAQYFQAVLHNTTTAYNGPIINPEVSNTTPPTSLV